MEHSSVPLSDPRLRTTSPTLTIQELTRIIRQLDETAPWRAWLGLASIHISTCLPDEQPCLVADLTQSKIRVDILDPAGPVQRVERMVIMTQAFFDHCQRVLGPIDPDELAAFIVYKTEGRPC